MAIAATTPPAATRPRADRVDGVLGEVGALVLGALPGVAGEGLGAEPVLQLVRGGHQPGARALRLDPARGGDRRGVSRHRALPVARSPYQPSPPAMSGEDQHPDEARREAGR